MHHDTVISDRLCIIDSELRPDPTNQNLKAVAKLAQPSASTSTRTLRRSAAIHSRNGATFIVQHAACQVGVPNSSSVVWLRASGSQDAAYTASSRLVTAASRRDHHGWSAASHTAASLLRLRWRVATIDESSASAWSVSTRHTLLTHCAQRS